MNTVSWLTRNGCDSNAPHLAASYTLIVPGAHLHPIVWHSSNGALKNGSLVRHRGLVHSLCARIGGSRHMRDRSG